MQDEVEVICPYCRQPNTIGLDWGGAHRQDYEEDCQVCCRPWRVRVELGTDHAPQVRIEQLES
jgi:hypothetical protein